MQIQKRSNLLRLCPLQNLRDIGAHLSIHLSKAGRIADQAAGDHVLTDVVHRRDPQTICQRAFQIQNATVALN